VGFQWRVVGVVLLLHAAGCRQILGLEDRSIDASVGVQDGAPPDLLDDLDDDDDTIPDLSDNCPTKANANQYNEDADDRGDACDVCPGDVDNGVDADGDLVGDICDPHPGTAGDHIVLFEGFHDGIPSTYTATNGTWTSDSDDVVVASGADIVATLTFPNPATMAHTYIVGKAVVGTIHPPAANGNRVGIVIQWDQPTISGIACAIGLPFGATQATMELRDSPNVTLATANIATFVEGNVIDLRADKLATTYGCTSEPAGTPVNVSGASAVAPAIPHVGFRTRSNSARYKWLMVIESP